MADNIENITISLSTSSTIERWKNIALDLLFGDNLNRFQMDRVSSFIDKELAMYNFCDLSSCNETYKKLLKDLELEIPDKKVAITNYNLKFATSEDAVPTTISTTI